MRRDWKRRLAVLLAASMVLSSNVVAFADEAPAAEEIIEDAALFAADTDDIDASTEAVPGDEDIEDVSDAETADTEAADTEDEDAAAGITEDTAEAEIAAAEPAAEVNANENATVSSPFADPEKWSTDPKWARYTYGIYLPEFYGYEDADMVSTNKIYNNSKLNRPAVTGDDLPILHGVSFNCIKVQSGVYVVYAYGITNEFDGNNKDKNGNYSASVNNYWGMTPDNIPAGVFDYTPFTWSEKSGGPNANGRIKYDAAVITWKEGSKAVKERLFKINKLSYKNNKFATVSFDNVNGKWQKLTYNVFQKNSKQPSFYPVLKFKKFYRDDSGKKVKVTSITSSKKEDKKLLKEINKLLKNNKINFEIRRRPIAGTVSEDYIDSNGNPYAPWKYASLMGDDLDFKTNGKLKKATLQFKSTTYTIEKDGDADDYSSDDEAGSNNTKTQAIGYYLTHVLKMTKMKDSDASKSTIESEIKSANYKKKTKTDTWYTTKTLGGYDTLIVYGANNLEGVAAFRLRDNKTVGVGYYKSDKDCFISSLE